jgi:hypothetical protein
MCCFSQPVPHVSATSIFARVLPDGRQALAYEMSVEVPEDLAMVLPLPVPLDAGDDAVTFVDLSGYPEFFTRLSSAFPVLSFAPQARGVAFGAPPPPPAAESPRRR